MSQLLRAYVRAACLREAAQSQRERVLDLIAHARKLTQAVPEIDGWDRTATRYMPNSVDPKQAIATFNALEAASKAWDAAYRIVHALDYDDPEDRKLVDEVDRTGREVEQRADDIRDEVKDLKAAADKRSKQSSAIATKGLKSIGTAQVEAIYNAARRAYSESDAMLVDDALDGAKSVARRYGISPLLDWGWFPIMYGYIRAHRSWSAVRPRDVANMVEYANEDIERYGKKAQAKRRGRR